MKPAAHLFFAIAASCTLYPSTVRAEPPPIVDTTFETDPGDWRAVNLATGQPSDAAKVSITHVTGEVKEGRGSLKLEYNVKKGEINVLILPVHPPSLVKMKSLHFWVKLDHSASLMLVVSEKDGDSYREALACTANTWQEVSVALSDLVLSEDQGPPKDPDAKLHPDRIDTVGLMDADCYIREIFGDIPFLNIASGSHTLYLNSFTINETALPAAPAIAGEQQLSPLLRPQVDWMVFGDMSVHKVSEKPLTSAGIRTDYTQSKGKVFGLFKSITVGSFSGVKHLDLTVASTKPTKLMVQVEQTDGNKFNSIIDTTGESAVKSFELNMSDFMIDKDSKDPNAKLDLALVKQFLIIDIGGAIADIQETENTLWINDIRAIKK